MTARSPTGGQVVRREQIPLERLSWLGLASAPLWLALFLRLGRVLGGRPALRRAGLRQLGAGAGVLLFGVPLVHEAVHGAAVWLVGGRPRFGVGPGFAYTTFQEPVSPRSYRAISLAPFVAVTMAGLALLARGKQTGLVLTGMVGNAAGAAGDFWVVWRTRSLSRKVRIRDLGDGFEVYLPDQ